MNAKELRRAAHVAEIQWRKATKDDLKKRARHKRDSDLWDFRQRFKVADTDAKLRMLKVMADAVYQTGTKRGHSLDRMRSRFNFIKHYYKAPRGRKCEVCAKNPAAARHHIIQLQNGGGNHGNNLLLVCDDCHAAIHPWLAGA